MDEKRARKAIFASELRRNMTPEEAMLWNALRNRQCEGLKFRRQVTVDHYVVDFLCYSERLIVEVDGGIHETRKQYDAERDQYLKGKGYRILHINNQEIQEDLSVVLYKISTCSLSRKV